VQHSQLGRCGHALICVPLSNGLGIPTWNDWPRYVEEEPEIYEREELDKLFAAYDADERLWYEFFLMTGMREQEVMHCGWSDLNLQRSTATVRYKPEYGFSPKSYRTKSGLMRPLAESTTGQ
jgi:integrase